MSTSFGLFILSMRTNKQCQTQFEFFNSYGINETFLTVEYGILFISCQFIVFVGNNYDYHESDRIPKQLLSTSMYGRVYTLQKYSLILCVITQFVIMVHLWVVFSYCYKCDVFLTARF